MRHYIICIFLFTAIGTQAQQINPVPDYVFRNQMSVGRNAVTDTAAYISIGPRYGANKGLMPPIVSDTAAITGVKRNGLLIFSVQRNNFQYWDSINSRWTSVTANVDTTIISTRAWRKKGDDSLGAVIATKVNISDTATMLNPYTRGSGTVNYLPKFTGSRTLGNSVAFDNGGTELLVNTTSDAGTYALQVAGSIYNTTGAVFAASSGSVGIGNTSPSEKLHVTGNIRTTSGNMSINSALNAWNSSSSVLQVGNNSSIENYNNLVFISEYNAYRASGGYVYQESSRPSLAFYMIVDGYFGWRNAPSGTAGNPITYTDRMLLTLDGELLIGTTTDAGAYALQVAGSIYNTTGAVFAASSGEVLIGTTSDAGTYALQVAGAIYNTSTITTGAPTGGSIKPWRLGEAATVSPTSPNRTIRVEIDGTVYYIHAKTTND